MECWFIVSEVYKFVCILSFPGSGLGSEVCWPLMLDEQGPLAVLHGPCDPFGL